MDDPMINAVGSQQLKSGFRYINFILIYFVVFSELEKSRVLRVEMSDLYFYLGAKRRVVQNRGNFHKFR